jgi:hypothetical protein
VGVLTSAGDFLSPSPPAEKRTPQPAVSILLPATYVNECAHFILAANSWETPPSRARASARSRGLACGLVMPKGERPHPRRCFRASAAARMMRATTRPSTITPSSCSCGLTSVSPPAEKATARREQARQSSTAHARSQSVKVGLTGRVRCGSRAAV